MKCLKITGDDRLIDEFISIFVRILQSRKTCVISEGESGDSIVSFPWPASALTVMKSMPPDIVLVRSDIDVIAPIVHCGSEPIDDDSLLLARYTEKDSRIDFEEIYKKTFNLLPQKTAEECGRCGLDCRRFAEAVLKGERSEEECFYAPGKVEVKLGNRLIELGDFPAGMIEGTVRGLVSSLKGYNEKKDVSIRIRS